MKRKFVRTSIITGVVGLFMALFAGSAIAAFEVETLEAEKVGTHSATLKGKVYRENTGALANFLYGETFAYGHEAEATVVPKGMGWYTVTSRITGLKPNTTYHFRFGAWDGKNEYFGQDKSFKTSSDTFAAAKYPAELLGEQEAEYSFAMGFENGLEFSCYSTTFEGELGSASSSISLTPQFNDCLAFGFNGTVSMNGCGYVFNGGSGTSGTMDINCPAGKVIEVSVPGICAVTVPAQTGLAPVEPTVAGESLELGLNVSGLHYTKTFDGWLCPLQGTGAKEDGTYTGNVGVDGYVTEGGVQKQVALSMP